MAEMVQEHHIATKKGAEIMKKKILSLALCAAMSVCSISASVAVKAESYTEAVYNTNNSNEVDYSLWDKFIKYDLCIADYDSLTDKEKELCKFIFETENSSNDTIICERARRILAHDKNVGERITLDKLKGEYGIGDLYDSSMRKYYYNFIHCVPDIKHIDQTSDRDYNEYWLDDSGNKKVYFKCTTSEKISEFFGCKGDFTEDEIDKYNEYLDTTNGQAYVDAQNYDIVINAKPEPKYKTVITKGALYLTYPDCIKYEDSYYYITNDNEAVLLKNTLSPKAITSNNIDPVTEPYVIPEKVNGCPVVAIETEAFSHSPYTEIILPDTIRHIGSRAFMNSFNLEKINFPDNLETIDWNAFWSCCNLKSVYIDCPNLYVAQRAFELCGFTDVVINAKSVSESAFMDCSNLRNITINFGDRKISPGLFKDCSSLKNITLQENLYAIGAGAFSGTGITALEIPESVEIVGALPARQGLLNLSGLPQDPPGNPLTNKQELIIDAEGTIFGTSGSEAEKYAKENNIEFVDIDSVRLSKNKMNLIVGEEDNLQVKNYDGEVQWKSEDESVASVENGVVKALGEGTTNILAVIGDKTLSCKVAVSTTTVTTTYVTTTTTTTTTTGVSKPSGDADGDGKVSVRDCAFIAKMLANGKGKDIQLIADFNGDGKVDVRDAAAIARYLAKSVK